MEREIRIGMKWTGFWLLICIVIPAPLCAQIWENKVLIEGRDPVASQNGMAWDENGHLHLILTGDNQYHLWFDGQTWLEDKHYSCDQQTDYSWIAMDRDNLIHGLFRYGSALYYYSITSSGWDAFTLVAWVDDDSNINPLIIDSKGNPHTVYTTNYGFIIHAFYDEDEWKTEMAGCADDGHYEAGFVLDTDDNMHVCFVYNGELTYRKFNGFMWQEDTVLLSAPSKLMMKLDDQGVPHIVYILSDETGDYLGYSTKTGNSWINEIVGVCSNQGSLVLDHNNTPHIICNSDGLRHFYRDNGQWVEDIIDSDNTYQPYVSAGCDPDGILTVCAVNTVGKRVVLFRLIDDTWKGEKILEGGVIGEVVSVMDHHDVIHALVMNSQEDQLEYGTIQDKSWVSETLVTDMAVDARHLSIGVDGNDKVHCCYADPRVNQIIHQQKTQNGWEYEVVSEEAFHWCRMAVANNGDLAVLASSVSELVLFRKVDGTWSITSLRAGEYDAGDVCMDSHDFPHAVFSRPEQSGSYKYHPLYYLYYDDGIWKEELIHSQNAGTGLERTILVMDASDSPRVMQNTRLQGSHYKYDSYTYSTRDDQGWHNVVYSSMVVGSISLGLTPDDKSVMIYNYFLYNHIVCNIESDNGEWIRSIIGDNSEVYDRFNTIMADSTNHFYVLHNYNDALNFAYLPLAETGVTLEMPRNEFSSGKKCYLNAYLRHDESPLLHAPFCVLLEYQQNFWFWPDWQPEFRNVYIDVWRPGTIINIIPWFTWPYYWESDGSAEGLVFWAALLNEDMTEIIGGADGLGRWEFSYY